MPNTTGLMETQPGWMNIFDGLQVAEKTAMPNNSSS